MAKKAVKNTSWFKDWDKSSIAAMIANLLTFIALCVTIQQNKVSDNRYFENDSTSKIDQKRVSERDSAQLTTVINSFTAQQAEYKRLREKDETNIALYKEQLSNLNKSVLTQNKQLDLQNQLLEVERLSNQSYLTLNVKFDSAKKENIYSFIRPIFSIKNSGKSPAQNILLKYFIVTIDNWKRPFSYIYNKAEERGSLGVTLEPNDSTGYASRIRYGVQFILDNNQSAIREKVHKEIINKSMKPIIPVERSTEESIRKQRIEREKTRDIEMSNFLNKYPTMPHNHYLIVMVRYQDKYVRKIEETYYIHRIVSYFRRDAAEGTPVRISAARSLLEDLPILKPHIKAYNYNYEKILEIVQSQSDLYSNTNYNLNDSAIVEFP